MATTQIMVVNRRRPLDNQNPNGYIESDKDYVLNNIELCVKLLDKAVIELADKEVVPL